VNLISVESTGTVLSHQKISETQGGFTGTLDELDDFGGAICDLGDLDGPGPASRAVVIGAAGDDDGGIDRGAFYVLFIEGENLLLDVPHVVPSAGALSLARPNPFISRTAIPFRLAEPAWVEVDVCDLAGRRVRSLVRGYRAAGDHQAIWDGAGEAGRRLSAGTYFYRMSINGRSLSGAGRVVLLD
jgi:hypothetical protein